MTHQGFGKNNERGLDDAVTSADSLRHKHDVRTSIDMIGHFFRNDPTAVQAVAEATPIYDKLLTEVSATPTYDQLLTDMQAAATTPPLNAQEQALQNVMRIHEAAPHKQASDFPSELLDKAS